MFYCGAAGLRGKRQALTMVPTFPHLTQCVFVFSRPHIHPMLPPYASSPMSTALPNMETFVSDTDQRVRARRVVDAALGLSSPFEYIHEERGSYRNDSLPS